MTEIVRPYAPVEDRLAIQELSSLYSFYCDTRQYEEMAGLFAPDGIFDETAVGAERVSRGPAEVAAQMIEFQDRLGPCIHICSNHLISYFAETAAKGTCHVASEGSLYLDGKVKTFKVLGYYEDEYEKSGIQWLIKARVLRLLIPYSVS